MFEVLSTGIEELDLILGGGLRFPSEGAAFVFISGGPGTGKTILGLELVTRAWLGRKQGGGVFLFYSVEQAPEDLQKKLEHDFGYYFGAKRDVRVVTEGLLGKVQLEVEAGEGGVNRLILLQANPASLEAGKEKDVFHIADIEWIQAEIGNLARIENIVMVCLDNIGLLLSELDYMEKRAALLRTRRELMKNKIHGIFILEETKGMGTKVPSPEEFSTDLLLRLSFMDFGTNFKARMIEIEKARHQYYYRGLHHFSIVGKGAKGGQFLGARSEKEPGVHIYPSIPAQLSLLMDAAEHKRPVRGPEPLYFGIKELDDAFDRNFRPQVRSSTVVLAEPGSYYTTFGLHFAVEGLKRGEKAFLVSTKEDYDSIVKICRKNGFLKDLVGEGGSFNGDFKMQYLHPEHIPPGKFTWDILGLVGASGPVPEGLPPHRRLIFDNIHDLDVRFPLIEDPEFLILALLDLMRHQGVSPLFIELLTPGKDDISMDVNPYLSRFDNVIHIFPRKSDGGHTVFSRIIKAMGCNFTREAIPLTL